MPAHGITIYIRTKSVYCNGIGARLTRDTHRMTKLLMTELIKSIQSIDGMMHNESITKQDSLLRMRQELCALMQALISEPHRTSFAVPQPADSLLDDFILQKTLPKLDVPVDDGYRPLRGGGEGGGL